MFREKFFLKMLTLFKGQIYLHPLLKPKNQNNGSEEAGET
jgi:hypothetical protein